MSDALKVLETAVSDVGYWSWWTGDIVDVIQIEFGGVQLWSSPLGEGKPPNGQIALRFDKLQFVAFLTRGNVDEGALVDWPALMARDELGNAGVDEEAFTLTEPARLAEMVDAAAHVEIRVGDRSTLSTVVDEDVFVGMWAGDIGIVVVAEELRVLNHTGGIDVNDIAALHNKWWEYWKAYWKSKDTDAAMPKDYACEVTIPVGWD